MQPDSPQPVVVEGSLQDLPEFIELLEEVGAWLWGRGVHQWRPGSMGPQRPMLAAQIAAGGLLAVRDAEGLAGACVVTQLETEAWQGREGDSFYLHKLAVSRRAAGLALGVRIVRAAEAWTIQQGAPLLRLDCWDGNAHLRAYYSDQGFQELDAVEEHGYWVRLFEKALCNRGFPRPGGVE